MSEFDDIMNRLRQLVRTPGALPQDRDVPCRCQNGQKIFVELSAAGRKLSVCPQCDPRRSCTKCSGTGDLLKFNLSTLGNDVLPFGCVCTQLEKRVQLFNAARVPGKYLSAEFGPGSLAAWEAAALSPQQVAHFTANQDIVYNFCTHAHRILTQGLDADDRFFLLLMGPVGTGKTYMAIAALRRMVLEYGLAARYVDFLELLTQLREVYSKRGSEDEILRPLREVPVLVIDEFAKGRAESEWQLEKLDDLVNARYNHGRITLITTNYLTTALYEKWRTIWNASDKKHVPQGFLNRKIKGASRYGSADSYLDYERGQSPSQGMGLRNGGGTDWENPPLAQAAAGETFWTQDLAERIGARLYDRLVEASVVVDFVGCPSLRRGVTHDALASRTV